MAKADKTVFFCKECGYESAKWLGQCPGCKEVAYVRQSQNNALL